jgi:hypothetical protein
MIYLIISLLLLTGCTYNVSMAHTEGLSNDVIDDTSENTPDISPQVTIPMSPTGL